MWRACRRNPSATCRRRRWWRPSSSPCAPTTMQRWAATPRAPSRLADGRLHLQHGPIDLIIEAFGATDEVERAYGQAVDRFGDILSTLVRELPTLRRPVSEAYPLLQGPVARRMAEAVWPHRSVYITPMAAVAGALSDEMGQALVKDPRLDKSYVNPGAH